MQVQAAQVTLDMDGDTLDRVRAAARAAGVSMNAWLTQVVREHTRAEWPREVVALAGAWPDLPPVEELRAGTLPPPDAPRDSL